MSIDLRRFRILVLTVCSLVTSGLLFAAYPASADNPDGLIDVGGEHIITIRTGAKGFTLKERADAVTERLVDILSDPDLKAADIVKVPKGADVAIMVKQRLLITVTALDGQPNQMTADQQATAWAQQFRRMLPRVSVKSYSKD